MMQWSKLLLLCASLGAIRAFQLTPNLVSSVDSWKQPRTRARIFVRSVADDDIESVQGNAPVDVDALLKYHGSIAVEMGLFSLLFKGLDVAVDVLGVSSLPFSVVVPFFYFFSLRSRIFNPLNNERPKMPISKDAPPSRGFMDRKMPSFTPPGFMFPIVWILIIGPIRAYSSWLVYATTGHFFNPALLALMFHLSVGDVWNTINNVEKRYGAAVTGVLCVTASALNAAFQYYQVDEFAGKLLALPMIWFAVASSLVTATWKINPINEETGEIDKLYPIVGEQKTKIAWFGVSNQEI